MTDDAVPSSPQSGSTLPDGPHRSMVPHSPAVAHVDAPTGSPVRVLYVAGTGRSGSTLISNLIGSVPGALSVGELRYLWERGIRENGMCGCGERFAECPFWAAVLEAAYPGMNAADLDELVTRVVAADHELLRLRQAPGLLRRQEGGVAQRLLTTELSRIYRAIAQVARPTVIVDSSKLVSFALIVARTPGIELSVAHLVRDPRGAAHSWSKQIQRTDRGEVTAMGTEPPLKSGLLWSLWNGLAAGTHAGAGHRYARVRYEDVMATPREALAPTLRMVGLDPGELPEVVDGHVHLAVTHSVAGNPGRMRAGAVPLRTDAAWTSQMPRKDRIVVTAATAPLLPVLGYRPGGPAGSSSSQGSAAASPEAGADPVAPRQFVEDMPPLQRTVARARRNLTWIREQGLSRVLEEKEIDPLRTIPSNARKAAFRSGRPRGQAVPVFLLGLQRSGTNMVVRGLGMAPEVEVHNENDAVAFTRFKLRPLPMIEAIVAHSRHTHVLFKPLCDSHRALDLLSITAPRPPRVLWAYRDVDGRVRSSLAKFGDGNLQVLREFAAGVNTTRWHVQGMAEDTAEFVRSLDFDAMTPESGSALMWYVRNRLYFDQGLHLREDVHLARYEAFLAEPQATMKPLCDFLGFEYRDDLVAHVTPRPPTHTAPLALDPRVRDKCDELAAALQDALEQQAGRGPQVGR
ncbi:MAG: sulfotransferase [Kineosporiaceae bacterium]